MKPFYSVDDLDGMFELSGPENIADALRAAGVPLIHEGQEADLSNWKGRKPRRDPSGALVVERGGPLEPDPDEVIVSYESLPESWKAWIQNFERDNRLESDAGLRVPAKELTSRERNNLLRLIAALAKHFKYDLDGKGAPEHIAKLVEIAGFSGPKSQTIRNLLAELKQLSEE